MLSISTVSSSAASSGYYSVDGYYAKDAPEAHEKSRWFGETAKDFGLRGTVDPEVFNAVLKGETPDGYLMPGRINADGEREFRAGVDLTFSASKSVSIAALVFNNQDVITAHNMAVRAAMSVVEKEFAQTRDRVNGHIEASAPGKIVAGLFQHETSRNLDPTLHTHAVIANMMQRDDGRWTALHNDEILKNQLLIRAIYHSELEKNLQHFGLETARGKHGETILPAIPERMAGIFSSRSQEIRQSLEERGIPVTAKSLEEAALRTRSRKTEYDRDTVHNAWLEIAKDAIGKDQFDRLAQSFSEIKPSLSQTQDSPGVLNKAIQHLAENNSTYTKAQLITTALRFAEGQAGYANITSEITRQVEGGNLFVVDKDLEIMTDSRTIATERQVLAQVSEGKNIGAPVDVDSAKNVRYKLSQSTLSDGQKEAVTLGLLSPDRVVAVQGIAGTGKTFMLDKLTTYAQAAGLEVRAFAPSDNAAKILGNEINLPTRTSQYLVQYARHNEAGHNPREILIIDEASLLSSKDAQTLLQYANDRQVAKVIFVGDVAQHTSVGAGTFFNDIIRAGVDLAVMDDVKRQNNIELRDAVLFAARADVGAAMEKIQSSIIEDKDIVAKAVETWAERSPEDRTATRIITLTNDQRREVNHAVRDILREEGAVRGPDKDITGLRALNYTQAEKMEITNYTPGLIVVSHGRSKQIDPGVPYAVAAVSEQNITLQSQLDPSASVTIDVSKNTRIVQSLSVFETETKSFAVGDQVRFRAPDKDQGIVNGTLATISGVDQNSLSVTLENGAQVSLSDRALTARTLELNYAVTSHMSQGETHDKVIAVMPSKTAATTDRALYVNISRARDEALVVTDDRAELERNIALRQGLERSALEGYFEQLDQATLEAEKLSEEEQRFLYGFDRLETVMEQEKSDQDRENRFDQLIDKIRQNPDGLSELEAMRAIVRDGKNADPNDPTAQAAKEVLDSTLAREAPHQTVWQALTTIIESVKTWATGGADNRQDIVRDIAERVVENGHERTQEIDRSDRTEPPLTRDTAQDRADTEINIEREI